jgi:hypothetical protein
MMAASRRRRPSRGALELATLIAQLSRRQRALVRQLVREFVHDQRAKGRA